MTMMSIGMVSPIQRGSRPRIHIDEYSSRRKCTFGNALAHIDTLAIPKE